MSKPSRIRILPDETVNKVAAGEVVERPAAALKELLENSLDAGARRLEISIEGAGRRLIRVRDDGEGMSHDEVLLALERHSTSKISAVDDLDRIGTFGFRGEALPSLAAVSRMQITTRRDDESGGTRVIIDGGRIVKVSPWGAPRGTEIEMRHLFRNIPARLKFLKSDATELAHCVGVASRLALAHPSLSLGLSHGKRELIRLPPAAGKLERLRDHFGGDFCEGLLPFEGTSGDLSVAGFVARPGTGRPGGDYQLFFVNGRPVKDFLLLKGIGEACRDYFLKEREPLSFFIWISLPPAGVDVNVHPTKREVRFRDISSLRSLLEGGLRRALKEDRMSWFRGDASFAGAAGEAPAPFAASAGEQEEIPLIPSPPHPESGGGTVPDPSPGQLFSTYLLAVRPEGLLIVDQHAAHERIHYEKALRSLDEGKVQRLLHPPVLELSPAEAEVLEELLPQVASFGIEIDHFGPRSFRIAALTPDLPEASAPDFVRDLIERSRAGESPPTVSGFRHRLAAIIACHGSVRARERLTEIEQRALLEDLFRTEDPAHCPHGRPTFIRLDREEIERRFRRT